MVAVLATTALGLGSRAFAQSADQSVYLNLKDADMVTATRMLTQKAGVQFLIEPSDQPYAKVTMKLDGVTAEDAVRYMCQAAGAYFRRDENGVFIISHHKTEPLIVATPTEKPVLRKLRVLKANAQDIYYSIVRGEAFDAMRGFQELRKFTNFERDDVEHVFGKGTSNVQFPDQMFSGASSPVNTSKPLTGAEEGGDIAIPGESGNQLGGRGGGGIGGGFGGGRGGGAGGFGGAGGGGICGGGIGGGGANGGGNLQAGQGLVPDGIDYINYDPTDNSIVVMGTEQAIADLQQRIGIFDVAPRQVLIKVEYITTTSKLQDELGYSFNYNRGAFSTGFNPSILPGGQNSVGLSWGTGAWALRLRAALVDNNGTEVSAPQVRTFNNQPAQAFFSSSIPVFIPVQTLTNGSAVTQYNVINFPVTNSLSVTPRINDDNTITMTLAPQISSINGFSVSPDGLQEVPNTTTQAVLVSTRVKDGETIALAGFNSKQYNTTVVRVPVLSDLPLIGQFFRSRSKNNNTSELLIFVTAKILDEDETSGISGP